MIIAIDLGTTGNRAIAYAQDGTVVASSYMEFPQYFPQPGWVEHDPEEIWQSTLQVLKQTAKQVKEITAIGISNQRETTIIWDKNTGKPIYPAIVWQCRRTAERCQELAAHKVMIQEKTGLMLDAYFSASKIEWILNNVTGARDKAEAGELLFGTVDSWILWKLTAGAVHATDASNASRSLIYNIHSHEYDEALQSLFSIPSSILPEVQDSDAFFGETDPSILGKPIPIHAMIGDQQASLFASCGEDQQQVKNTYGTGLFVVAPSGKKVPKVKQLVATIAWSRSGEVSYAVEGSVFVGGSAIQWLRDGLKILDDAASSEAMAMSLKSNEGVYFVPGLVGLGAPHWDAFARGMVIGLTRGTTRAHMVRAALEALAYQTKDVVDILPNKPKKLRADGGAAANKFLMQFQADLLAIPVEVPENTDTTALGAAGLAGIASGFWSEKEFRANQTISHIYEPQPINDYYRQWQEAVKRAKQWV